MEFSSKRVFRLRAPIAIHWARRHYDLLESTPEADGDDRNTKPSRKRAPPKLRLGRHRKKRLFIAGICRRLRVRILGASTGLLLFKRLKAFYHRLLAALIEAGPGIEMINSGAFIDAHSF